MITARCASSQLQALGLRMGQLSIRNQGANRIVAPCTSPLVLQSLLSSSSFNGSNETTQRSFTTTTAATSPWLAHCKPTSTWVATTSSIFSTPVLRQERGFVSIIRKKKKKQKLSKKKEHEMKMKAKRVVTKEDLEAARIKDEEQVAAQHREWVDFQKSISVEGFDTGQSLEVVKGHTRNRQLRARKRATKLLQKRILKRKEDQSLLKTGEIPALSYSPEETARLLAEAEAAIPKRMGKRGHNQLRRQRRRWWLVRQIHKKYKKNIERAHFREMQWRSDRKARVVAVIRKARMVRVTDREYQLESFKRWAKQINADIGI